MTVEPTFSVPVTFVLGVLSIFQTTPFAVCSAICGALKRLTFPVIFVFAGAFGCFFAWRCVIKAFCNLRMKLVKQISMQALDNLALTPFKPTKSSIRHAETLKLRGRYGEVDVYRVRMNCIIGPPRRSATPSDLHRKIVYSDQR